MGLLQTITQRVFVGLHHVLLIQVYIVTSQATPVVLFHHALKPTALLRTTQRVFVVLRRVLQVQGYTVPTPHPSAVHSNLAPTLTAFYPTPLLAPVQSKIARQTTASSAMPKHNHVREEIAMVML